jgi:dynein heavy chain
VYQWEKHDVIHQPPAPVVEEGKPTPPVVIKTLYRLVSEHKDVVKVVIVLNSIISSFKMDAKQVLSGMAQFEELWNQVSQWKNLSSYAVQLC